ncbi:MULTISPECIES: hypothetical protein [unclassified Bacillus (in: firmicutes)]|nr:MULTISPECIES: hypothetical protein [unclassified Bacillus (in: firmicutes)]SFI25190.1 hypothetical protein SAMN04488574_102121 [Bacillus sp. 71mf]SFS41116.1 hypothetical protein SAMN04488145_101345 [Bacillus sp. 103mf]
MNKKIIIYPILTFISFASVYFLLSSKVTGTSSEEVLWKEGQVQKKL